MSIINDIPVTKTGKCCWK